MNIPPCVVCPDKVWASYLQENPNPLCSKTHRPMLVEHASWSSEPFDICYFENLVYFESLDNALDDFYTMKHTFLVHLDGTSMDPR